MNGWKDDYVSELMNEWIKNQVLIFCPLAHP